MITSILRWIRASVAAMVAVILAVPLTAAASLGAPGVAAYAYDSRGHSAFAPDAATERGPPPEYDRHTTYEAVGRGSHGALARPDGPTTSALYTYDDTDLLAQFARGNTHSAGRSEVVTAGSGVPQRSGVAANAGARGWTRGDDIYALTNAGNKPAWSTVRSRYWKNEAANPQIDSWSAANLERMRGGRAPQRYNRDKGGMESMELSHEPIPRRHGGTNVVPRWPQDHAAVDPYRYPGY